MLVLSRNTGEELMIGEDILIRVVKTANGRVTLAFDAPKSVSIMRSEIGCDRGSTLKASVNPK